MKQNDIIRHRKEVLRAAQRQFAIAHDKMVALCEVERRAEGEHDFETLHDIEPAICAAEQAVQYWDERVYAAAQDLKAARAL